MNHYDRIIITDPCFLRNGNIEAQDSESIVTLNIYEDMFKDVQRGASMTYIADSWTYWFGGKYPVRDYRLSADLKINQSGIVCVAHPDILKEFGWDNFCNEVIGCSAVYNKFYFMPFVGEVGAKGIKIYTYSEKGVVMSVAIHVGPVAFDMYRW